ncbi:MAG: iron-sulfur cluster carrier protein ApbC [Gammaproteobacteria bacterium]|jgi:ATP-binding protein involved in chromosome partitioning
MSKEKDPELTRAIEEVRLPVLDVPLGRVGSVEEAGRDGTAARIVVRLRLPLGSIRSELEQALERAATDLDGIDSADVEVNSAITAQSVQQGLKPLAGVSNIIAVASGKGGVGKSTTAVNLALALAADGARVGILDADIYGPSIPRMLGLQGENPVTEDGKLIEPMEAYGLQAMSIGFLVDDDQPMVWRGPMVTQALNQLLSQTRWRDLDYLLVDMPPGTGDIQLTLSQQVPVSGAIVVTTPQDIALLDARKGLEMFRKVSVAVLGVVENMSTHVCSQCGHVEPVFGAEGGRRLAEATDVELLGQLPLDMTIREDADGGRPSVVAAPDGPIAAAYREIALKAAAALAASAKDYSRVFPKIVVEDS